MFRIGWGYVVLSGTIPKPNTWQKMLKNNQDLDVALCGAMCRYPQKPIILQLLYFEWSPSCQIIFVMFLTPHLMVYMACIFWHSILAFYLTFCSDFLFWHSIWHPFWHLILPFYLAFILAFFLASVLTYFLASILTFHLAFYLASILPFSLALVLPGLNRERSHLRSGSAHCDLVLAVETRWRQRPLKSVARLSECSSAHFDLALMLTAIWRSRLTSGMCPLRSWARGCGGGGRGRGGRRKATGLLDKILKQSPGR